MIKIILESIEKTEDTVAKIESQIAEQTKEIERGIRNQIEGKFGQGRMHMN